jgi:SEC-C motif-containing protein
MDRERSCPCDSGASYAQCCGRYLETPTPAPDAESLMRSRYCAYVLGREDYLLRTWHVSTRPARLELDELNRGRWLGLKVLHSETGDAEAFVEFVARYKLAGRAARMHERSRFLREDGQWYYVNGEQQPPRAKR